MLSSNNIWLFLLAVLPILVYSYALFIAIPKNLVSLHRGRRYMFAGLLSPSLISLFYFLFPNWGEPQSNSIFIAYFIFTFLQIGVLEETTKYITFQWISLERHSAKHDFPIATMFYAVMSSVGFALVENISYLIQAKNEIEYYLPFSTARDIEKSLSSIALLRCITAVLAHMIFGVVMGYFLAKAQAQQNRTDYNAEFDNITDSPKYKRWKYIVFGIVAAAILHGTYDFNLMIPDNGQQYYFLVVNILFGLVISNFLIKDLINQSLTMKNNLNIKENEII